MKNNFGLGEHISSLQKSAPSGFTHVTIMGLYAKVISVDYATNKVLLETSNGKHVVKNIDDYGHFYKMFKNKDD